MTDVTQRQVVVVELYATSASAELAAVRLDAEHYPGESMATQSRRYRKAKALHDKAEAYRQVAKLAELFASAKEGDTVTFTIDKGDG